MKYLVISNFFITFASVIKKQRLEIFIKIKVMQIPVLGKEYYFFDDGKISLSRCYKAKVTGIYPYNEKINVKVFDYDLDEYKEIPIQEIHKKEVDSHRQGEHFKVLGGDLTTGAPWLYSEKTDYFIKCEIKGYDKDDIWFARTIQDGWFSMDVTNSWQSGELDVDGKKYEEAKHYYDLDNYDGFFDSELMIKGEFIEI